LIENALLQKKLSETQILVDQYNKLNPQTFDLLPTRVIGINRYLIIDRGSDEGITSGQAVVYKDNFVGLVKDVSPKTSRVILPQDPDSKIPVFSQNTEGTAKGMLIGQFGSELLIDKILHQEVIKAGDLVYSEGTEGKLPKGLIIGKVTEVFERQNEIFKQAKVDPVFDIADLDVVFAIRNP
jgi:rod shape-determining protein MreC